MKNYGYNLFSGHTFTPLFIEYHLDEAENNHSYQSAKWLKQQLKLADQTHEYVDSVKRIRINELSKGGLRSARQREGFRGKRGVGMGDHTQLRLAAEVSKLIDTEKISVLSASIKIGRKFSVTIEKARSAYYRYRNTQDLKTQLVMDEIDTAK